MFLCKAGDKTEKLVEWSEAMDWVSDQKAPNVTVERYGVTLYEKKNRTVLLDMLTQVEG